jgi:transcriptional regulator with XRE-family HTH domain
MNRIRELRESRGWTQEYLGKLLNVQKSAISKYEIGRVQLTDEIINKLAKIFNVSADYILGISNIKNPESLTLDEELQQLLNDPNTLVAFKDFHNLSDTDKQEIINFIKFKKQQKNNY